MAEQLVLLRNSERSTFRRCRWKWARSYMDRLEPNHRGKALTFGSMVHGALERWYVPGQSRGQHPAEAFIEIYDADADAHGGKGFEQYDEDENKIDARELGWAMLTGYVERWGEEPELEIICPEMSFQIDVYDHKDKYLCTLVGTVDGPGLDHRTGRIVMLEHKTAKSLFDVRVNSGYGEQGITYWWGGSRWLQHLGILEDAKMMDGIMFNVLRKAMPDERAVNADGHRLNKPKKDALVAECHRQKIRATGTVEDLTLRLLAAGVDEHAIGLLGEVSKVQPKPLFMREPLWLGADQLKQFERRMRMDAAEMEMVRKGRIGVNKNPTKDCDWDCPFVNACELHEMGADYEAVLQFDFKKWDPYEAHELEAEHS